ncbi:glycoside hydrolase family 3 C-terminal domain-containing protein [Flavobacterium sp. NG2]|uniref:glycoside hydrolase family 3 C-terminal domain-containing protein n=1 Tax=Flavobacterium sp. NG2 TaxID=3097547 RepID=UPI002A813520|nr:glycoside hydrolase family 3 C-terminal domain-containing protein [Flavobacterium sp. NG2]WPR71134.1 glycoside hydrolase family 3 C-terminal domain-containing protein [Flavobacterium sp. NG2]
MKQLNKIALTAFLFVHCLNAQTWKNPNAPVNDRVKDLLSKMTLEEKISQCSSDIPAIERLGIPSYMWYAEALHGVIAWKCTSFPQNIAMGATWNPNLMFDVATAISNEARALKNSGQKEVMMFSPTINMARDPRWGRNEECYSEDPFMMSEMARMYVRGMQGNDKKYLKTVCTVKHYIANNVENRRESIQSNINEKDLREYYMPAYRTCVADEEAGGIMSALNGLNGIPSSGHNWLLNDVLRKEWGFEGYVVADWNAASGMFKNQKYAKSYPEAAALAIKATCDQECFRPKASPMVKNLKPAIEQGLLTEAELDQSVARLLRLRFLTGDFDKPEANPWHKIPQTVLESDAHKKLALKAAEQSIVLLKNEGILPLKKDIKSIAVLGPFANRCWMGIYSGFPQSKVSPLQGIKKYTQATVNYAEGCDVIAPLDEQKIKEAVEAAKKSEVALLFVGNDEKTATENKDRQSLSLPGAQQKLIEEVLKVNKNTVVIMIPSGATTLGNAQKELPGIICAWPNGQEQGNAIAHVLWGEYNPGGKLNSTWYASDNDLPDMHDYNIKNGRTYMYFKGKPLYPFGYGLSYTSFQFKNLKLDKKALKSTENLSVSVQVTNTGKVDGDEVVQLYIRDLNSANEAPAKALKGFERIHLKKGETKTVQLSVPYQAFSYYNVARQRFEVKNGSFEILVGNSSDNLLVKETIQLKSGTIPVINVKNKSAYFNPNDPNRSKNWDAIYEDKSFLENSEATTKEEKGIEFKTTFTDPGFYVNTWDAVVNLKLKTDEAIFKLSMLDNEIDTYKVSKGNDEVQTLSVKIPIPPEYGKEVILKAIPLKGKIAIESIKIIPPGNVKPYLIYPKNQ